jgi:hypothetical protein
MEALASSQAMIAENPLAALGAHSLMPSRVYSLLNL